MKYYVPYALSGVQPVVEEASKESVAVAQTAVTSDYFGHFVFLIFTLIVLMIILVAVVMIELVPGQREVEHLLWDIQWTVNKITKKMEGDEDAAGVQNDFSAKAEKEEMQEEPGYNRKKKTAIVNPIAVTERRYNQERNHTYTEEDDYLYKPGYADKEDCPSAVTEFVNLNEPDESEQYSPHGESGMPLYNVSVNDVIHYNPQAGVKFDIQDNGSGMFQLYSNKTILPDPKCLLGYNSASFYNRYDFPSVFEFQNEEGEPISMKRKIHILNVLYPAKVRHYKDTIVLTEKGILIVEEK